MGSVLSELYNIKAEEKTLPQKTLLKVQVTLIMKTIIISLFLAASLISCEKIVVNPVKDSEGNYPYTPDTIKPIPTYCWTCLYEWWMKDKNNNWYRLYEKLDYCGLTEAQIRQKEDTLRYDLPDYKSSMQCWKKQ